MAAVAPALAPAAPLTAKDVATTRKRRRRVTAGGAADDCFTCAKRNVKCDRRRPYCSQCLEIGNECSGYKTQLTWGVGVASRGKLRGLSLPVVKAAPVGGVTKSGALKSPTTGKGRSNEKVPAKTESRALPRAQPRPVPTTQRNHSYRIDEGEGTGRGSRDAMETDRAASTPGQFAMPRYTRSDSQPSIPPTPRHWTPVALPVSYSGAQPPRYAAAAARGLHLTLPSHGDMMEPAMHDVEYLSPMTPMSPMSHSYPPRDGVGSFLRSPALHSPALHSPALHSPALHSPALHSPALHSPSVMCFGGMVYRPHDMDMQHCEPMGRDYLDAYGTSAPSHGQYWASSLAEEEQGAYARHSVPASPWPLVSLSSLPSKMAFFTDYYEHTMCPSMVFIDGPGNPYREHVLRLGGVSRSLQHAICALAACNLRMKRRLSLGQMHCDHHGDGAQDAAAHSEAELDDQSISEEVHHRNLALHLLDEQLNDSARPTHDAMLATMLIMCHYRMVESGVAARFHTQFAGLRKRLDMRPKPDRHAANPLVEGLLTFVDAISATINEHEAQPDTWLPDAQPLPSGIENLVGCDRHLFRIISKLGRLNLLSQQRPVRNPYALGVTRPTSPPLPESLLGSDHLFAAPPSMPMPSHHQQLPPLMGSHSHPQQQQPQRYDGHGLAGEEDLLHLHHQHPPSPAASTYDDQHQTFWREWYDTRAALQNWEFDAPRVLAGLPGASSSTTTASTPSPSLSSSSTHVSTPSLTSTSSSMSACPTSPTTTGPTSAQVRDLGSVSEAFRYAALLYTERLGSPAVPSAHQTFRTLVSQVFYYATSLAPGSAAEKFLLWPLFVAGSECVNEYQQHMLREKLRDMVAKTGYMNNLAALDVLERLWAGEEKEDGGGALAMRRGPFHWTRCMGGPGFEAEWILF